MATSEVNVIQPIVIAGAINGIAGALLYFVSKEAPSLVDVASVLYLLTSIIFCYVGWPDSTRPKRITRKGKYKLTTSFVGLANNPSSFHEAGFIFTVTDTCLEDYVVFIPEFGGWTYYEIPARAL